MDRISIPEAIAPTNRIARQGREDFPEGRRRRKVRKPISDEEPFEPEATDAHDLNELA